MFVKTTFTNILCYNIQIVSLFYKAFVLIFLLLEKNKNIPKPHIKTQIRINMCVIESTLNEIVLHEPHLNVLATTAPITHTAAS